MDNQNYVSEQTFYSEEHRGCPKLVVCYFISHILDIWRDRCIVTLILINNQQGLNLRLSKGLLAEEFGIQLMSRVL
jgi:hypothetical protein